LVVVEVVAQVRLPVRNPVVVAVELVVIGPLFPESHPVVAQALKTCLSNQVWQFLWWLGLVVLGLLAPVSYTHLTLPTIYSV